MSVSENAKCNVYDVRFEFERQRGVTGWGAGDSKLPLTANSVIFDAEKLGFVVARDCGVSVRVSWQHGQRGWQVIRSSHPFFF